MHKKHRRIYEIPYNLSLSKSICQSHSLEEEKQLEKSYDIIFIDKYTIFCDFSSSMCYSVIGNVNNIKIYVSFID